MYGCKIELFPCESPIEKYENKNKAVHYSLVGYNSKGRKVRLQKTLELLDILLPESIKPVGKIMLILPMKHSCRLKQTGFELVARIHTGEGIFILDTDAYINYLNKKDFNVLSLDDGMGKSVQVRLSKRLPEFFNNRLTPFARKTIDGIFSKEDTAYMEVDFSDSLLKEEVQYRELVKHNKEIFKYLGFNKLCIFQQYDVNKTNWKDVNASFVGRFKEISKSATILYV